MITPEKQKQTRIVPAKQGYVVHRCKWEEPPESTSLCQIQHRPQVTVWQMVMKRLSGSLIAKRLGKKLFHLNYRVEFMMRPKRLLLWEHVGLQCKNITDAKLPDTFEAPSYRMNQRTEMNIEVLQGGNEGVVLRQQMRLRFISAPHLCQLSPFSEHC